MDLILLGQNHTTDLFQGCGYPPRTVCKDFTDKYALNGTTFECFVSRAHPSLVIVNLDLDQVVEKSTRM